MRPVWRVIFLKPAPLPRGVRHHTMKNQSCILPLTLLLASGAGCISHHETITHDVPRTPVEFENDAAARLFYEAFSKQAWRHPAGETRTKVEIPIVFEHEVREIRGENQTFNDAIARCDTNHDARITEAEARIYAESLKVRK